MTRDASTMQLNSSTFGSSDRRSKARIEGSKIEQGKAEGPKSRRFVRHTRTLHMRPRSVCVAAEENLPSVPFLSEETLHLWTASAPPSGPPGRSDRGYHRRRPPSGRNGADRGKIRRRTAENGGGSPSPILPSIFLVAVKVHIAES